MGRLTYGTGFAQFDPDRALAFWREKKENWCQNEENL